MITVQPITQRKSANVLGEAVALLLTAPAQMAAVLASSIAHSVKPGCEIPPPCWEPRKLGTCSLVLTPDSTGTIRLHITNCNWQRQVVALSAIGQIAGITTLLPSVRVVELQDTALMLVRIHVPPNVAAGRTISGGIIVRGCQNHYLHVTVQVAECADDTCCDVVVKDCRDQVHHWYDHFYCARPCNRVSIERKPQQPPSNYVPGTQPGILSHG